MKQRDRGELDARKCLDAHAILYHESDVDSTPLHGCPVTVFPVQSDLMTSTPAWLRRIGRPARGPIALTVALGEAAGILLVVQTGLLVSAGSVLLFGHATLPDLVPAILGAVAAVGARAALTWGSRRAGFAAASAVKRTLRRAIVDHLRAIGPRPLAGLKAGEIAHTAVDAVEALDSYYSKYLPQRAIASLLPLTILAVVFPLDWLSGLILVLTAVFLPLSMIVIGEEAHERNRRLWGKLALMSGKFLDVLQGLSTVRMFGAARREAAEIQRASSEYRDLTLSVLRLAFLSSFMLEMISAVSIAIVAVVSGLRLLHGTMGFVPGYFVLLAAPEYFLTLRTLGTLYHARMEAVSAAEQIRSLLETPAQEPASSVRPPFAPPLAAAPSVVFDCVRFSDGGRMLLAGASFRAAPGERLALTGASGAGKSTILFLLLRFAVPSEGTILVDGLPLDARDPALWRSAVAWLPQSPTLVHGTIRDNLLLGMPRAGDADIARAVRLSRMGEFLPRTPAGLSTKLGEAGQGLSSGQAQRVALARLFLRRPWLVLLDEPAAHLDPAEAALVSEGIAELCQGRTTILVTHRAETTQGMDGTLVLRDGVVERVS
jgi:ATP-binding cassette subfamily C protein CydD